MTTEQLFGAVQRECRDSHVSVMGVEQNLLSMKRQVFEAREWEWDPTEMEESEEYDVKAILGVSFENGLRSYRVQWSDLSEGWEPEESLTNVQEMLVDFHSAEDKKAAAAAGKRGSGRKAKAKTKKKQVVVEESDSDSDEVKQPSEGGGGHAAVHDDDGEQRGSVGKPVGDQGRRCSFEGWNGW